MGTLKVSFTASETDFIFNQQVSQSQSSKPSYARPNIILTMSEIQVIFDAKGEGLQRWYADKLLARKEAKCCTCSSAMPAEKLYVFVNGL